MGFGTIQRSDSLARLKKEGLKRFHLWPKEPKEIDLSVENKEEFDLSKEYEVQFQLMVNSAESESSPIIGGFPAGTCVKILCIGSTGSSGRRLKVTNKSRTVSGWVPSVYRCQGSLVAIERKILDFSCLRSQVRRRSNSLSNLPSRISSSVTRTRSKTDLDSQPTKSPQIGDSLEMDGRVILREDESMSSPQILTVKGGCKMRILDYGKSSQNRVKVSVNGTVGWVTILDKNLHEPLFGRRPSTY
jgi:hypothetical protein